MLYASIVKRIIIYHFHNLSDMFSISDSNKISVISASLSQQTNDHDRHHNNNNYLQLLQQREEENRQEVAKLTSEIRALKVQLIQLRSMLFL